MFEGVGRLKWRDAPEPLLGGPREALVRPIAVARCDLDPFWMTRPLGRMLRLGMLAHQVDAEAVAQTIAGSPPFEPPFPVGHECVAEVTAVGADVRTVQVGQRVVVPFCCASGGRQQYLYRRSS